MSLNTLSMYLYAGLLNVGLSLVLFGLAYLRPGTQLFRKSAYGILVLSASLIVAGFGTSFPRWVTVIGTNVVLLAASVVFQSGVAAFGEQRQQKPDWLGWGLVAITVLPFWYWGLVEPNGYYRSAVFSFALAAISARTTYLFSRTVFRHNRPYPNVLLTALFGALTLGMLARGLMFLVMDPAPLPTRGSNPTTWITVFWYIALASAIVACIVWVEFSQPPRARANDAKVGHPVFGLAEHFQNKLLFLWTLVVILAMTGLGEAGVYYTQTYAMEEARLIHSAELTNEAFVNQTKQIITQVDTVLYAVRNFYHRTRSLAETEAFIDALPFDKSVVGNVYLITSQGEIAITHDPAARGKNVADRDYFAFLKATAADEIFIGSVESGRVTGKFHFRIARRMSNPDGSFAGIVLGTVDPESISSYYGRVSGKEQSVVSLIGTSDKKFRARFPGLPVDRWQSVVESPIWDALKESTSGVYQNASVVDHIQRTFAFKKLEGLPFVMVTGFSQSDVRSSVYERLKLLGVYSSLIFAVVLTLAILLTIEIRRRAEQDRFLSMLSHELKTPLSTIRLTLGGGVPDNIRLRIGRSVDAMNSIIERCLQSDRLAYGRVDVTVGACDVAAVVNDIRTSCSAAQRVAIEVIEVAPVQTDQQLFSVIVSNLIDNALKYGAADALVQVRIDSALQRGVPGILVEVSNFPGAAGMPDPRKVFRKYYRAPGAHGKIGSGLGLHIAAGFAKKLGGRLRYLPTNEKVKFMLWIPA